VAADAASRLWRELRSGVSKCSSGGSRIDSCTVRAKPQAVWALRVTAKNRYSDRCCAWGESLGIAVEAALDRFERRWGGLANLDRFTGSEGYAGLAARQGAFCQGWQWDGLRFTHFTPCGRDWPSRRVNSSHASPSRQFFEPYGPPMIRALGAPSGQAPESYRASAVG